MFDLNNYHGLVMRTAKTKEFNWNLIHAALGLTSEAGEFADAVKAHVVYNKHLDHENLVEELGDLLWFITYASDALGVNLSLIAEQNIAKLRKRYPEGFSERDGLLRADKIRIRLNDATESQWDRVR